MAENSCNFSMVRPLGDDIVRLLIKCGLERGSSIFLNFFAVLQFLDQNVRRMWNVIRGIFFKFGALKRTESFDVVLKGKKSTLIIEIDGDTRLPKIKNFSSLFENLLVLTSGPCT